MNKIVVGVLAGRGENEEVIRVLQTVLATKLALVMPLFGVPPTGIRGKYLLMPEAAKDERGKARTALLQHCVQSYPLADLLVLLDDDTEPQPGYLEYLANMPLPEEPTIFGGKLLNFDGSRSWDVCSFQNKHPVVVPYEFWDHHLWSRDLYLSGPQHIFNKAGFNLAVQFGYPPLKYGEDTNFCFSFKQAGGRIQFLPDITAKLLHQHKPPNYPTMFGSSL